MNECFLVAINFCHAVVHKIKRSVYCIQEMFCVVLAFFTDIHYRKRWVIAGQFIYFFCRN